MDESYFILGMEGLEIRAVHKRCLFSNCKEATFVMVNQKRSSTTNQKAEH